VINSYVAQGTPLLSSTPSVLSVTDSSFILKDKINANGGSTITASGAVWGIDPDPKLPSPKHTSTGVHIGAFFYYCPGVKAKHHLLCTRLCYQFCRNYISATS
jgi:hypothetical protein